MIFKDKQPKLDRVGILKFSVQLYTGNDFHGLFSANN